MLHLLRHADVEAAEELGGGDGAGAPLDDEMAPEAAADEPPAEAEPAPPDAPASAGVKRVASQSGLDLPASSRPRADEAAMAAEAAEGEAADAAAVDAVEMQDDEAAGLEAEAAEAEEGATDL